MMTSLWHHCMYTMCWHHSDICQHVTATWQTRAHKWPNAAECIKTGSQSAYGHWSYWQLCLQQGSSHPLLHYEYEYMWYITAAAPQQCCHLICSNGGMNVPWTCAAFLASATTPGCFETSQHFCIISWYLVYCLKFWKSEMVDGGCLENRDIFKTIWLILTEFCRVKHISPPDLSSYSKIQFKNTRWHTATIFKIRKWDNVTIQLFDQF